MNVHIAPRPRSPDTSTYYNQSFYSGYTWYHPMQAAIPIIGYPMFPSGFSFMFPWIPGFLGHPSQHPSQHPTQQGTASNDSRSISYASNNTIAQNTQTNYPYTNIAQSSSTSTDLQSAPYAFTPNDQHPFSLHGNQQFTQDGIPLREWLNPQASRYFMQGGTPLSKWSNSQTCEQTNMQESNQDCNEDAATSIKRKGLPRRNTAPAAIPKASEERWRVSSRVDGRVVFGNEDAKQGATAIQTMPPPFVQIPLYDPKYQFIASLDGGYYSQASQIPQQHAYGYHAQQQFPAAPNNEPSTANEQDLDDLFDGSDLSSIGSVEFNCMTCNQSLPEDQLFYCVRCARHQKIFGLDWPHRREKRQRGPYKKRERRR